jgi:hypothetical protein
VYIAWDLIDFNANTEIEKFVACKNDLSSCSSPITITCSACTNVFSPFVAVAPDGSVEVSYEQLGNTTTDLHLVRITGGLTPVVASDHIFHSMSWANTLHGQATDSYRITTQVKIAIDTTTGSHKGHTYATWDQCASAGANYYFGLSCSQAVLKVNDIPTPTSSGTSVSVPAGNNQTFPSIAVDETGTSAGHLSLAYYTTQNDSQHTLIRVYEAQSSGGTSAFGTPIQVTTANINYLLDPLWSLNGIAVFGDYIQVVAENGKVYVHFNATFEQKSGPSSLGTTVVNQGDNYLCELPLGSGTTHCV